MDGIKQLPREVQGTLVCLILFIIFSFFDWQQVSVGPFTAGKTLWHGIGIITVLIAIAYLIWEIGRALNYNVNLGPGDARNDVRRVRGRAARLHRHHVLRLERLPPLAGVDRPDPVDPHRGCRVRAREGRGRRAAEDAAGRVGQQAAAAPQPRRPPRPPRRQSSRRPSARAAPHGSARNRARRP